MHDLIHELAQSVSSPLCCQVRDNEPCPVSSTTRHVSLLCNDVEEAALEVIGKSKKLRTLLAPGASTLDLSSSMILELPDSVKELKLLRYLNLSKTEIRKLPDSVCSLYHLQTLKLLQCPWFFELPKGLGNLTNLEHLELDAMFRYKSSTLPPRMGSLTKLQNLHKFHVGKESGIDELQGMIHLKGTLRISKLERAVNAEAAKLKEKEGLKKVVFEWSDRCSGPQDEADDERVLEDLQPHSNLEELQISYYRGTSFPSWIRDGLLRNLSSISISHCTKCKVLSLGQLPHLGELNVKGMHELEEWSEGQYDSLHRLKLSGCPKLKKLPSRFDNLRDLKIKRCNSLTALPLNPSLELLILVENLVLENWKEETVVVVFINDRGEEVAEYRPSFINLLELKIINCPKLQALPIEFVPHKLEISGCQLFRKSFSP